MLEQYQGRLFHLHYYVLVTWHRPQNADGRVIFVVSLFAQWTFSPHYTAGR